MKIEEWKEIPGYAGRYLASNFGRIKSKASGEERLMKPKDVGIYGHAQVGLRRDGGRRFFYVHQLVLMTFIGPPPKGMECLHVNGNARDCSLENLRYGTRRENAIDRVSHGNSPSGSSNGRSVVDERDVRRIRGLCNEGVTQKEIGKMFGISQGQVSKIFKGDRWKC